jgi:hypothetical protein
MPHFYVQGDQKVSVLLMITIQIVIARAEPDDPCAETRFRLSEKRTSPFESAGVLAQSAGRRLC